jgi:predicted Zn-ribbon and HTH transcriptional regulator
LNRTRRQRIVDLLKEREWEFVDLRRDLSLTVSVLEEDLRHIERSVRPEGIRLIIRPARCDACGFHFRRAALHPPGRCPVCRDRRISGPWFRIS